MTEILSIPPKLLHKNSGEDVLLSNPRKVLPAAITAVASKGGYSMVEIGTLSRLYRQGGENVYVLSQPPNRTDVFGLPFAAVSDPNSSRATRGIPHQVIDQILEAGNLDIPRGYLLDDQIIEGFLTHHNVGRRSTSFTFVNRADHYFFYGKPHEHVPGIMFLEAARQTIYYQLYTYSEHALGDVTVSLSELNAKFYAYGELMYPIEIVVDDLTDGDERRPRMVRYSASFYQRGLLIAEIETVAPVISLEKFKTARNAYLFNNERFAPLPGARLISLITAGDAQDIVSIREIGRDYCLTSHTSSVDAQQCHLSMIYDGNISFRTSIHRVGSSGLGVAWKFDSLKYIELENLKEIVKRGFILSEVGNRPGLVGK